MFNIATRKVGGIRFLKIGRLTLAFCLSPEFRPFRAPSPRRVPTMIPVILLPLDREPRA